MRARAVLGSLLFLFVAPGVVAGLIPWWLTGWEPAGDVPAALVAAGAVLVAGGSAVLLHAFARFALDGLGTPAPVAPTARLVVGGAYRHVRNPMYLAVGATILGQALILGQPGPAGLPGRVRRGGGRVRARLRGAGARAGLRHRVRRVPARRPRLDPAAQRSLRSAGTSTACSRSASSGTISSARSCVEASTT